MTADNSNKNLVTYIPTLQEGPDGSEHIRVGKLNLVDLAGSERQSKTGSTVSLEE